MAKLASEAQIDFRKPKALEGQIGFRGPDWLQMASEGQNWFQKGTKFQMASEGQNWFQAQSGFRRPKLASERTKLASEGQNWQIGFRPKLALEGPKSASEGKNSKLTAEGLSLAKLASEDQNWQLASEGPNWFHKAHQQRAQKAPGGFAQDLRSFKQLQSAEMFNFLNLLHNANSLLCSIYLNLLAHAGTKQLTTNPNKKKPATLHRTSKSGLPRKGRNKFKFTHWLEGLGFGV